MDNQLKYIGKCKNCGEKTVFLYYDQYSTYTEFEQIIKEKYFPNFIDNCEYCSQKSVFQLICFSPSENNDYYSGIYGNIPPVLNLNKPTKMTLKKYNGHLSIISVDYVFKNKELPEIIKSLKEECEFLQNKDVLNKLLKTIPNTYGL